MQMRATCPEDLLAFVPVAIGFDPAASVVLLSVEGQRPFHARIALPDDESDVDEVVEALLRPARLHAVTRVVFVVYDDDTAVADEVAWSLHEAFCAAGIEVVDVLRVHDDHYFAVLPGRPQSAYRGVPFDSTDHPFTAQAVFGGRVTHTSREALAATIEADVTGAEAVDRALSTARMLPPERIRPLVVEQARTRTPAPVETVAALTLTLTDAHRRDEAWQWLRRHNARDYVDFWSNIVRRAPHDLVPGPAAVLALTAWLAGDGALAWCAVDRARAVEPAHSLAGLVADLLMSATSPDSWDEVLAPIEGVA